MVWEVEYTDEFGKWWDSLTESEAVKEFKKASMRECKFIDI